ncbi:MAG: 2,3-bisphosphoglycerate-independent phosphoglycerate mutase [Lachnospiraceae bacterium]|nr:2,3-bisphosphoglycerate-independent phosphoglycerate mutase [Lachnospiraceae bacterium]
MRRKPTVLMIMDGFGIPSVDDGPLKAAPMPVLDRLKKEYPFARCLSAGMAVGLPNGQMGNSETGYVNIGAGRIVYQELTRINGEIRDGSFFTNRALQEAISYSIRKDSNLHIFGLMSDGGVHSHISHLFALLEMVKRRGLEKVYIHCFLDGRDVLPGTALHYVHMLQTRMRELGLGEIASLHGRYYAMDRDNNYDRLKLSYAALTEGEGMKAANADDAIRMAYERGETDEFILPTVIVNGGVPVGTIDDDDSVVFFNFRADRARELTRAFCDDDYRFFKRGKKPQILFTCFSDYDPHIENKQVAFEKKPLVNTFGEWISMNGMRQLKVAESEKYAQITYFMNGGTEEMNDQEDRLILKSPKVATYDQKPAMYANELTDETIKAIRSDRYDVIIMSLCNLDLTGHAALESAVIAAAQTVDLCIGRLMNAILERDGILFICSDHGKAEKIVDEGGHSFTMHTNDPVPFLMIGYEPGYTLKEGGCLADIVPTIIETMEMEKPSEMTGKSLLLKKSGAGEEAS